MSINWSFKVLAALAMAVCVSGCELAMGTTDDQLLQSQMLWNASRKAELGLNDQTGNSTSPTDRRAIDATAFVQSIRELIAF